MDGSDPGIPQPQHLPRSPTTDSALRGFRKYIVAALAAATATSATLLLQPTFDRYPYLPLLLTAVVAVSWLGGFGPGAVAASMGVAAGEYLFVGDLRSFAADLRLFAQFASLAAVAAILASASGRRVRAAAAAKERLLFTLGERVKELTLLHEATRLLQGEGNIRALLREFLALIPAGWQFPGIAEGRIIVGEIDVATPGFTRTAWMQRAEFPAGSAGNGAIEVAYRSCPPTGSGEPFLPEERTLIGSLASLLASHFDRLDRVEERLELARAEASRTEAEAANRAKDAFLGTVSHELRRPLTAILGWIRMLRRGDAGDFTRGLQVIERSADSQLRMVNELLDVTRITAGHMVVGHSIVNLNDTVRNVIDAATPVAGERHLTLVSRVPAEPTHVSGDALRLQQIVDNLAANAIKFTPQGGRITVTVSHDGQHARIEVADTGMGIDPSVLPRLFEPFWQADASSPRSREGLGLGLSIVRRLVELHLGTIEAHSNGLGLGTCIAVTLPLAQAADAPLPAIAQGAPVATLSHPAGGV
ncbi:MAG TPA: ATP-binding protein [Vicinamibacterales bacterium]|jgi:signal transduction histidine kinase|nr:ATP-binding protein [Vicinamibacterales bacterium]